MDRLGLGTSFLPAKLGSAAAHWVLRFGIPPCVAERDWLPIYPRVVMPQTFTPVLLGSQTLAPCQDLGLQGRVPVESHQVITGQEHRLTVARL